MSISLAGNSQFDPLRFVDREYVAGVVPNAVPRGLNHGAAEAHVHRLFDIENSRKNQFDAAVPAC